jgi:hypothetical protein
MAFPMFFLASPKPPEQEGKRSHRKVAKDAKRKFFFSASLCGLRVDFYQSVV